MFSILQGRRPNGRKSTPSNAKSSQPAPSTRYAHRYAGSSEEQYSDKLGQRRLDFQYIPISSQNHYTLPPISRVSSNHEVEGSSVGRGRDDGPYDSTERVGEQDQGYRIGSSPDLNSNDQERIDPKASSLEEAEGPLECKVHGQTEDHVQAPALHSPSFISKRRPTRTYTEPIMIQPKAVLEDEPMLKDPHTSPRNSIWFQSEQTMNPTGSHLRHGKTRLNILNPMSLLARRRSAQTAINTIDTSSQGKHTSSTTTKQPDDYDPRIRGKVVHDFSAPRPIRYAPSDNRSASLGERAKHFYQPQLQTDWGVDNESGGNSDPINERNALSAIVESPNSADRAHTPVFREHFGLETQSWRFDEDDRRNQQTKRIMDQVTELDRADPGLTSLPPFARNLPDNILKNMHDHDSAFTASPKIPLEAVSENLHSNSPPRIISTDSSPLNSPPKTRSRSTSSTDISFQPAGLSKRMASTASRFSFDLAGVGSSAQEELLEEKHRQHEAQKASSRTVSGNTGMDGHDVEEEDDYVYDDLDEFDGLEEKIPGVNADADEELNPIFYQGLDTARPSPSLKSPTISSVSTTSTEHTSVDSPRAPGKEVAAALDGYSDSDERHIFGQVLANEGQDSNTRWQTQGPTPVVPGTNTGKTLPVQPRYTRFDEDDLYFDDGMIDDLDVGDGEAFDESLFDDDTSRVYGLPLRDLKPPMTLASITGDTYLLQTKPTLVENKTVPEKTHPQENENPSQPFDSLRGKSNSGQKSSLISKTTSSEQDHDRSVNLTQDNLAAYHSALAFAANQAARSGKFNHTSIISDNEDRSTIDEIRRSKVTFDDQALDGTLDGHDSASILDDSGDFDFNDNLEDDPIVAAANAEALENDDEGFYGQEFGFYAHATSAGEVEYANGGYFGSAGGIRRSHSGRANFQEPSLTPITERSEWSNRNSMIAHAIHGSYPQPLQGVGLAQLTDTLNFDEDSMSLSALMRLRRGAWGGSNISLPSSAGSLKSGSPQTYLPPMLPYNLSSGGLSAFNPSSSTHSLISDSGQSSADEALSGSLTLTLQAQDLVMSLPHLQPERSSGSDSSPKMGHLLRSTQGHSRNSSGADSVSYVKEVGGDGAGRWVLEKRRTIEGGQVEILGRQVVEGGRI